MLIASVWLCYFTDRIHFFQVLSLYAALGLFYGGTLWLVARPTKFTSASSVPPAPPASVDELIAEARVAAVVLRAALLFSLPNLSDDFYRFVWDGRLALGGVNPFSLPPSETIRPELGLDTALFQTLNSPEYYSVYPPVCQAVFVAACALFPENLWGSTVVMKVFLFAFECGTLFLLPKLLAQFGQPPQRLLVYALNPLVLIELVGNLHFEAAVIFFLALSLLRLSPVRADDGTVYYSTVYKSIIYSGAAFATAVCSKLLPLMFLPLFVRRMGVGQMGGRRIEIGRAALFAGTVGLVSLTLFLPFYEAGVIEKISSSLALYFDTFSFNAGVYYGLREFSVYLTGNSLSANAGRWLGRTAAAAIFLFAAVEKTPRVETLPRAMLAASFFYYALATTVHPWYLTPVIFFSCFTSSAAAVVWSLVIPLSYSAYRTFPYQESLLLVSIEYAAVFAALVYDFIRWRRRSTLRLAALD